MYYLYNVPIGFYTLNVLLNAGTGYQLHYPISVGTVGLSGIAPILLP